MGNQQETFKDNLVFITNTLLRRKFSKCKHVFDEVLIGLFLNRLKVIPIITSMKNLIQTLGCNLISSNQSIYLKGKTILEDIIGTAANNPALYLSSVEAYFNVEIE